MQEREIDVLDLHDMLAEVFADPVARGWVLDRRITPNDVGLGMERALRPWLDTITAPQLADHLIGGIAVLDVPRSQIPRMLADADGDTDFLIPPVPNTLF